MYYRLVVHTGSSTSLIFSFYLLKNKVMRIINCYGHLLTLLLLSVFLDTSWTADINTNRESQGNIHNNDDNRKNPTGRISKQVDQRISDLIAQNILHFGHNLGLELAALDPSSTKSEIFSPLSLMTALSFLALGATGKSYKELKEILGLNTDDELIHNPNLYHEEFGLMLSDMQHNNVNNGSGNHQRPNANWRYTTIRSPPVRGSNRTKESVEHIIKVANGLFVQNGYTLNPDYSLVLQSIYETELTNLDFRTRSREARDYINNWVDKATFGKISQIIKDDIDKSTNIILGSALYFKAFWEIPFFFRSTTEDNFYPDGKNNPSIKVQMMPTGGVFPFYEAKEYDCRIIGLPYKGNETTMYIIQPNNSTRKRLRELQYLLDAPKINSMIDNMERKTALMLLPKMHFVRNLHLKTLLQAMNVKQIFLNGYSELSLIGQSSQANLANIPTTTEEVATLPNSPLEDKLTTESVPLPFESIHRINPAQQIAADKYTPVPFESIHRNPVYRITEFISRFGESTNNTENTENKKNNTEDTTQKPVLENHPTNTSKNREKRKVSNNLPYPAVLALQNLESIRQKIDSYMADLYVDDILHSVDFSVDEQGTEAAAATLTYLHRSGTDIVFRGDAPFLIIIRHDPTKLPLFYGIINKPEL